MTDFTSSERELAQWLKTKANENWHIIETDNFHSDKEKEENNMWLLTARQLQEQIYSDVEKIINQLDVEWDNRVYVSKSLRKEVIVRDFCTDLRNEIKSHFLKDGENK